ncbi:hypothetical protein [Dactylosporangium sp. CA-139066]|uniref:hypothetical protein n=1 Tax=Dactylosporangium sp. CA-139066 TaxID=3239930 RepID=UPI003D8FAB38
MDSGPQWLQRYNNGQRDTVWHEQRQLGAAPLEAELAAEAQAVCDEMARRARQNIEVIVERLTEAGYRFHRNDDEETPTVPFVSYLNWVFRWGGFPWPSGNRAQWRVVHRLKRDLLPL